jgi:hypothetical protein
MVNKLLMNFRFSLLQLQHDFEPTPLEVGGLGAQLGVLGNELLILLILALDHR